MQTRIHFIDELSRLNHDVLAMGTRVEESLRKALEALKGQNVDLAQEVKASDEIVNALQLKIEDQAAVLIATQQPVARDLRELVTVFKVTDNLERAGDHAVHLAKAAIRLSGEPPFRQVDRLCRMAEIGCEMIRGAVDAYLNQNAEAARKVASADDLDRLGAQAARPRGPRAHAREARPGRARLSAPHDLGLPRAPGRPHDQHLRGCRLPRRGTPRGAQRLTRG